MIARQPFLLPLIATVPLNRAPPVNKSLSKSDLLSASMPSGGLPTTDQHHPSSGRGDATAAQAQVYRMLT